MFLKTLRIKGFKSFADPATLTLEPGVTVVVGPNGSGKSNVVDAIGWVLGAQAPSAVRSQKMDDVIFAGTSGRPALGRAEVSLTIDNSAGLLPIDFTEVTITRLLFRSGDSEYSINGVPCRLLDVQELLSDSGVGRQQHVIVSQGNIDGVLNARPEERRLIIEEAAGVLKYRRRKERAERRLASTEANLTRIQDLLREVRRQLRPLERQADAARRHGDLVSELRVLQLHLAGRELARLTERLAASASAQTELRDRSATLRAGLADLDARILAAEAELSALGATDTGDALMRLETLRERGRGQAALLDERLRGVRRELEAAVDEAVVASLESERAGLREESRQIAEKDSEMVGILSALDAEEEALAADRAAADREWGDDVPAPSGEAAAARSELAAHRASAERSRADSERLDARRASMASRVERLRAERDDAIRRHDAATAAAAGVSAAVESAVTALEEAEAEVLSADDAAREAEATASAWAARVEALDLALGEARQRAGTQRLAGLAGVLGTLSDLVEVDQGWEEAFEAAAGEALGAVVVADLDAARRALAALAEGDHRGAVLALGRQAGPPEPAPAGTRPVRVHVRPAPGVSDPSAVGELLDGLLSGAHAVDGGWQDAARVAAAHPGSVVVTTSGHRFGPTGWRLGAAGSGATGAALEEARGRAATSAAASATATDAARSARDTLATARAAHDEAVTARAGNDAELQRSAESTERLGADVAEAERELEELEAVAAQVAQRHVGELERIATLEPEVERLEAEEAQLAQRAAAMAAAREDLESRAVALRSRRSDADVASAALAERRRWVHDRLAHLDERLGGLVTDAARAAERRSVLEARATATERLAAFVQERLGVIETELAARREERRRQSEAARNASDRLEGLRRERSSDESALEEARTALQREEVADAEVRTRIETATESLRAELDAEPETAMAAECPPLPEGTTAAGRARDIQRELKAMGPINPLALQEFEELSERHEFLQTQLDDVRATRRELGKVIRAVDDEIVKVFAAAFADVSENFASLFETLFPGGTGRLRLTAPEDLLTTGIEIEAKPSGKNVKKLSLLSGGERSLTALAYLFAVFRSRPSPFYVMDEVEAALDDVNLHRFLDLVAEFRSTAQLVIVSHQKRTMESADVLYGVSMEPGGSSKVVSERAAEVVDLR